MADDDQPEDELLLDTPADEGDEQQADALEYEIDGEDDPALQTPFAKRMRETATAALRQAKVDREALQAAQRSGGQPQIKPVGARPKLAEFDYDEEKHDAALDAWENQREQYGEQERQRRQTEETRKREVDANLQRHHGRVQALGIRDYDKAESAIKDAMGPEFLQAIIDLSDDSAKFVTALGNSPTALASVAAEPNTLKRLKMLVQMEGKMKPKQRSNAPAPEAPTIQRGTASISGSSGDKLTAKLTAEAIKTGNFSKLAAHQAQQKDKARG